MPTLNIKNVPEALYDALRARAAASGRSLRSEVLFMMEHELARAERDPEELLRELRALRADFGPSADGPSAEDLLRQDRDR